MSLRPLPVQQKMSSSSSTYSLELMKLGPRMSYLCLIPPHTEQPESTQPEEPPAEVTLAHSWSLLQPLAGSCIYVSPLRHPSVAHECSSPLQSTVKAGSPMPTVTAHTYASSARPYLHTLSHLVSLIAFHQLSHTLSNISLRRHLSNTGRPNRLLHSLAFNYASNISDILVGGIRSWPCTAIRRRRRSHRRRTSRLILQPRSRSRCWLSVPRPEMG